MAKKDRVVNNELLKTVQYKLGYVEGKNHAYKLIFDELERAVVKDKTIKRGSPEYEYALRLTRRLGDLARSDRAK